MKDVKWEKMEQQASNFSMFLEDRKWMVLDTVWTFSTLPAFSGLEGWSSLIQTPLPVGFGSYLAQEILPMKSGR